MAKVVKELPPRRWGRKGQGRKYDWDTWLDGQVWKLEHGTDYRGLPLDRVTQNLRASAWREARLRGIAVHVHVSADKLSVHVQARLREPGIAEGDLRAERLAAFQAKWRQARAS